MDEEDEENPYGDKWNYEYPLGVSGEEVVSENACPNCHRGNTELILTGKGLDGEELGVMMCSDCGFMFDPETRQETDSDKLLRIENEIGMREWEEENEKRIMQEMVLEERGEKEKKESYCRDLPIEALEKEIEKNPENKWAHYYFGKKVIASELNILKKAKTALMKTAKMDEGLYGPYFQIGKLFYEVECYRDAEEKFREALKRKPDSVIINDYLARCLSASNVPSEMHEIQNMPAEDVFRLFEINLRRFIEAKLREKYGNKWKDHIPKDAMGKWEDKKKMDKERNDEELPIFAYADFPHLREIIIKKDNWREVFEPYFKDKEATAGKLKELEPIRLIIAHSKRPLREDEKLKIKLYYCDFQKRMQSKAKQKLEKLIEGEK